MSEHIYCHHHHHHHLHGDVSEKSVKYLLISFVINMLLSVVEFLGGIIAGSMALIGDALHNTSDAFSILIAVIAFKIGHKKANERYTFGFKRAEIIGGFVNLILLFISGCYLLVQGTMRLISPEPISGKIIIVVSVLALIIDGVTAKISHHDAKHNTNMRMVFFHNLADALGSVGVIISGFCIIYFGIYRVDGIVALMIAFYMIMQAVFSFKDIVNILMNAAPEHLDLHEIEKCLLDIKGVENVHHIHLWRINEHDISFECHIKASHTDILKEIREKLCHQFDIHHCTIQIEQDCTNCSCQF